MPAVLKTIEHDARMLRGEHLKLARSKQTSLGDVLLYSLQTSTGLRFGVVRNDTMGEYRFARTFEHSDKGEQSALAAYQSQLELI